jgi:ABC-type nitrate/sulfonate/bicarbonate transport system permease component
VVEGFLLAMSVAVPMRIAMGVSRVVFGFFDPLLELLRPIPPIAVIPLTILWFGIGELSKALLIAYAQALDASRYHISREVVLCSALPFIVVGARLDMGTAFIVFVSAD